MNHVHPTTCAVAGLDDGCALGARGTDAANDPTDTPGPTPTLFRAS